MRTVLSLFGTRPEVIKLAPVLRALERRSADIRSVQVASSQHTDLLHPLARRLGVRIDHDLAVMTAAQQPADVLTRVISGITRLIDDEKPDLLLVQGDTTTALAGALAASYARVPVGHVEAGLRTGNRHSPFPEEINRRLISQVADFHFAAVPRNVQTLLDEGAADPDRILLTGNPVVDSLMQILREEEPSDLIKALDPRIAGKRLLVLTTHRRENFGPIMRGHLQALRRFVERHEEVVVVFPVHPNPAVSQMAAAELGGAPRVHLLGPLEYPDFIHLLSRAWLIASDSGGIQEEAPTLGKPVLILRDTTERPEVIECGVGRLVGHGGEAFESMLEAAHADEHWPAHARSVSNPFGAGDAGERIAQALQSYFSALPVVSPAGTPTTVKAGA